jgi:hypothetical protein
MFALPQGASALPDPGVQPTGVQQRGRIPKPFADLLLSLQLGQGALNGFPVLNPPI